MEYLENLSNAIVQFEDGAGFSSASAPPNDIYFAEEGDTPIQDPMEFGEPANWTPLDGTPSLKRRRDAETYAAENQVFALTYFIANDVNMEDVTDVTEALELYLNLNGDILEMEELGLQKHPRYETANRLLSDLSYRLDELQTQTPEIIPNFELEAEYDAWRSAFTDGAAATQINKYQRGWMQKVMNPRSRQIKSMWNDAKPSFNEELKSAEDRDPENLNPTNKLGLPNYDPYAKNGIFHQSFLQRIMPLTWGLGIVGAFFLGKKL